MGEPPSLELLIASKILLGHGCYSTDSVLEESYYWCSSLEESCKIYYTRNLQAVEALISQRGLGNLEYLNHMNNYQTWQKFYTYGYTKNKRIEQ
jgi:ribulose-5-phosphate 4-epimerase/fuculose-1-phosphate aldolase